MIRFDTRQTGASKFAIYGTVICAKGDELQIQKTINKESLFLFFQVSHLITYALAVGVQTIRTNTRRILERFDERKTFFMGHIKSRRSGPNTTVQANNCSLCDFSGTDQICVDVILPRHVVRSENLRKKENISAFILAMGMKKTSYIYDSDDLDSEEDYPQYRPAPLNQKQSAVPPIEHLPELQRPPAAILPTRSPNPSSLSVEEQQEFNFQNILSKQDEIFVQAHDFAENLHHAPDSTFPSHHHKQFTKRQQSQSENNIEGRQYVAFKTTPHNLNSAHYSLQKPSSAPKDPWLEAFHTYNDEQSRYKQGDLSTSSQYQSNQRASAPNSFISQKNPTPRSQRISLAQSDRALEEHEDALAISYKLEGSTAAVDAGALIFTDADIPEIIERIKDCFYGGIYHYFFHVIDLIIF